MLFGFLFVERPNAQGLRGDHVRIFDDTWEESRWGGRSLWSSRTSICWRCIGMPSRIATPRQAGLPKSVIRCLITDGTARKNEPIWLEHLAAWIASGVELVQLTRTRAFAARDLVELTGKVLALPNPYGTKILVNDRADVALACRAHGVHLRDESVNPEIFARPGFLISAACHDIGDLNKKKGANFIVLAPIFRPLSKMDTRTALGVRQLAEAVRLTPVPILALGGITPGNARLCMEAGAAGIAGISYFRGSPTPPGQHSRLL